MRRCRGRVRQFHTHMPNATALSMVEGDPLIWAGQSALKFYGRTIVDEAYNGLALDESEGDRIAASVGDATSRVHEAPRGCWCWRPRSPRLGTICNTWSGPARCSVWRKSTGRRVVPVPEAVAKVTAEQMRHEGGRDSPALHLESIKRQLDRDAPEYRHDSTCACGGDAAVFWRLHADRSADLRTGAGGQGAAGVAGPRWCWIRARRW